jgi:hypothetical protein
MLASKADSTEIVMKLPSRLRFVAVPLALALLAVPLARAEFAMRDFRG